MVEAIGLAFTIPGLVVPTFQGLMGYYTAYKRFKRDIDRYRVDLQKLDGILTHLRQQDLDSQTIFDAIRDLDDALRDLERTLKKYAPPGPGEEPRWRDRVKYFFRQPKFSEAIKRIKKMQTNLNAALLAFEM